MAVLRERLHGHDVICLSHDDLHWSKRNGRSDDEGARSANLVESFHPQSNFRRKMFRKSRDLRWWSKLVVKTERAVVTMKGLARRAERIRRYFLRPMRAPEVRTTPADPKSCRGIRDHGIAVQSLWHAHLVLCGINARKELATGQCMLEVTEL